MSNLRLPQVRYADADGVNIAYEVRGDGPIDVVRLPVSFGGIVASVFDPALGAQLDRFASFSRLICLDRRGAGLSDPLVSGGAPPLEQQVADIVAVMDAAGSDQAALVGTADGGQVAMLFAAMYPHRVLALVLAGTYARVFRAEDFPIGPDISQRESLARHMREQWGDLDDPWGISVVASRHRDEPGFRERYALAQQVSASKATAAALVYDLGFDVRRALPLIQAPTLVVQPAESSRLELDRHARFLVEHIPNARLASYPGSDTYAGAHTPESTELIQEFLTGTRPIPIDDRVLATVLFTDIVGSTARAVELGDHAWRALLDRHDHAVRTQLANFRGREVSTAGDSFFATFDGPARAIRCAHAIIADAKALGVEIRAGVHTGECEVRGDDFGGIAVHTGARVAALAGAGQVLTTSTVKDLVAGSGIAFVDFGTYELKGIPEPWRIYEVA